MSWKIKTITLTNFKYFHSPKSLSVDSQNLLIYGENGSGKSSFYWALYTLFQSRFKDEAKEKRYFEHGNDENLRNRFSSDAEPSSIQVVFEDKANPAAVDKTYTCSNTNVVHEGNADSFFKFTTASSDLLNYKSLNKLTDFTNSQETDIFQTLVDEIFPYADFRKGFKEVNNIVPGVRNDRIKASEWWRHIQDSLAVLPHQSGKRKSQFRRDTVEYGKYTTLLTEFRDELKHYLDEVAQKANNLLHTSLGVKDVEIELVPDAAIRFNEPKPVGYTRDSKLHPFHVILKAYMLNAALPGGKTEVKRIKSFFNEAKLTCIGLAIRIAVVQTKLNSDPNVASVLCVDDLLMSLDMSYRMDVIKALLSLSSWQILFFTHDKALYNLMWREIVTQGQKSVWTKYEFYQPDPTTIGAIEPLPIVLTGDDYKVKIEKAIAEGRYAEAGNFMRKFGEHQIKAILPVNLHFRIQNDEVKGLMLKDLHDKLHKNETLKLYDLSADPFPNIQKYLERIMNPLSHDDDGTPIFRREIEACMIELNKLQQFIDNKHIIVKRSDIGMHTYRLALTGTKNIEVDFQATEQWDYFVIGGVRKYKNCQVQIKSHSVDAHFTIDCIMSIRDLYDKSVQQAAYPAGTTPDAFDVAICESATGRTLNLL